MLTSGHIAASYLISQSSATNRKLLTRKDILFIILCGNIFDFDFFLPPLFGFPGGVHHDFPIHTPLAGFIIFSVLFFTLRRKFSKRVLVLAGLAILSHLILDDLNYFIGLLGLDHGDAVLPQIQWEYPFNFGRKKTLLEVVEYFRQNPISNSDVLQIYTKSKLFIIEGFTVLLALFVYLKQKLFNKQK